MPTSARAGVKYFHARLNGEMLRFHPIPPPHSTHYGGSVRFRADVGIGPYILAELRAVQRTACQSRFARQLLNQGMIATGNHYIERFAALCNTPGESRGSAF